MSHAAALLRERLGPVPPSPLMAGLMGSLLAIAEDRWADAFAGMQAMEVRYEPEVLVYLARHYSFIGMAGAAVAALRRSLEEGFICASRTLRLDPWLASVRAHPEYPALLQAEERAQAI